MKVQGAVRTETARIAAGVAVLTVFMTAVFLVLGKFDYTVLLGALLGGAAAIGNFFLMALTVQKVAEGMPAIASDGGETEDGSQEGEDKKEILSDEAKQAGRKMQFSYTIRMLLLGGIAALAIALPCFHPWATLLPMLFPRIVIAVAGFIQKNQKEETGS